jgi:hypothetical protein
MLYDQLNHQKNVLTGTARKQTHAWNTENAHLKELRSNLRKEKQTTRSGALTVSVMAPGIPSKKAGHPQPESNFVVDL